MLFKRFHINSTLCHESDQTGYTMKHLKFSLEQILELAPFQTITAYFEEILQPISYRYQDDDKLLPQFDQCD